MFQCIYIIDSKCLGSNQRLNLTHTIRKLRELFELLQSKLYVNLHLLFKINKSLFVITYCIRLLFQFLPCDLKLNGQACIKLIDVKSVFIILPTNYESLVHRLHLRNCVNTPINHDIIDTYVIKAKTSIFYIRLTESQDKSIYNDSNCFSIIYMK